MTVDFPNESPAQLRACLAEISDSISRHFGFFPPIMSLIISDGQVNQTYFAGTELALMSEKDARALCERMLREALRNHRQTTRKGGGKVERYDLNVLSTKQ